MDPKKLREFAEQYGKCCNSAEALDARIDRRIHESEDQALVVKRYYPRPVNCPDCGDVTEDNLRRIYQLQDDGWHTTCSNCNRRRRPGSDTFDTILFGRVMPVSSSKPKRSRQQEQQSATTETAPTDPISVDPARVRVLQDDHECLIREFVIDPNVPQQQPFDVQNSDIVVHKD